MTKETCGYQGHVCGRNRVQFISRYRNENDYCVSGKRISLTDEGEFSGGTPEQYEAVRLFCLNEYADYLKGRAEFRRRYQIESLELYPFGN